ncbi:MAG: hypothetical protein HY720_15590 [Planctomycetes bacterium]|nr:hypothetical protein [Planctomycetota bacterium]
MTRRGRLGALGAVAALAAAGLWALPVWRDSDKPPSGAAPATEPQERSERSAEDRDPPADRGATVERKVRAPGGPEAKEPVRDLLQDLVDLVPQEDRGGEERDMDGLLAAREGGELDDPALAEALRTRLDRDPDVALELVRALPHAATPQPFFVAVRALAPLAGRPEVREGLLSLLALGTEEERELVPFAFLGTRDSEALASLSRIFADPHDRPAVRAAAGYVLAGSWDGLGASDREKARSAALSAATDERVPRVLRREALEVLAAAGVTSDERTRLEELAANERDPGVRLLYLRVLHPDSPDEPVRELPEDVLREFEAMDG